MKTFSINSYIDKMQNLSSAGKALYNDVFSLIGQPDKIILDFQGTTGIATLFLNTSLGDLMDIFGVEKIKKTFKYTNIQRSQVERIQKYFADYEAVNLKDVESS